MDLQRLGSQYGGWVVPIDQIRDNWIIYSGGVGEDTSFDEALIERFGCTVHAFDPTPRAIQHAKTIKDPRFVFTPVGLWDSDGIQQFWGPSDHNHVSHSIDNLQETDYGFKAQCHRLRTLMTQREHQNIHLLKIDIEGAEFRVLPDMLACGITPSVICVELHGTIPQRQNIIRILRGTVRKHVGQPPHYVVAKRTGETDYTFTYDQ